jgi:hypothetical protein
MATPLPVIVELDVPREIRWGPRARIRLDSLPRRPNRAGIYQFAAMLWAMLVDADDFETPEDLGEYLKTSAQVNAVGKAILAAQKQAADTEKNAHGSKLRPAPASS